MASTEHCVECPPQGSRAHWYCDFCRASFCGSCWPKRYPHQSGDPKHTRIPITIQKMIQDILNPPWTEEQREIMHERDMATLWISVHKGSGVKAFNVEIHKRYSHLVSLYHGNGRSITYFPRLISFIGPTMAGKSTLIRLLIERPWLTTNYSRAVVPVVGRRHEVLPTSGDVHLYRDPEPSNEGNHSPLFYADCEGFHGAEVEPPGSKAARMAKEPSLHTEETIFTSIKKDSDEILNLTSRLARDFLKQTTKKFRMILPEGMPGSKRENAVTELFPRLLYTFSDVVVYVSRVSGGYSMEAIIEKLMEWAHKSISASVNQPTLPHLIIALNAASPPATWDTKRATDELFRQLSGVFTKNEEIMQHKTRLEKLDPSVHIDSLEELLSYFYASVQFIWIPNDNDLTRLSEQGRRLHGLIDELSHKSQDQKRDAGMLLSSRDQELFFNLAFKHFTENIQASFDFIAEIFELRPISNTLGNNIYLFLRAILKNKLASATEFVERASPFLSSAIVLDVARHFRTMPGTLQQIYHGATAGAASPTQESPPKTYKFHIEKAVKRLCDEACHCGYTAFGQRCWNVRSGHAKGHQSRTGQHLGMGKFQSNFVEELKISWDRVFPLQLDITDRAINATHFSNSAKGRLDAAWSVHLENLKTLYTAVPSLDTRSLYVCFFCLSRAPFQMLPCGHAICVRCAQSYGKVEGRDRRLLSVQECFLHSKTEKYAKSCILQVKPPLAGVRILSLDGGGVRGIIELRILEAIEKKLGNGIRIQRFFDVIGGTSAGAFIAIGLGIKDWSVKDCIEKYVTLCEEGFKARHESNVRKWLLTIASGSIYQTGALEDALQAFGDNHMISDNTPANPYIQHNKVFATATSDVGDTATIIPNYIRAYKQGNDVNAPTEPNNGYPQQPYGFEVSEIKNLRFRLWEAARATSAAPGYFKPFEKSGRKYTDGGLFNNNPARIACLEADLLWPDAKDLHPDIVLSIGSGHGTRPASTSALDFDFSLEGLLARVKGYINELPISYTFRVLKHRLEQNLNSERLWDDHFGAKSREESARYLRLNPKFDGPQPPLDQVSGLRDHSLTKVVTNFITDQSDKIEIVARRLIATSFYFKPSMEPFEDSDRNSLLHGDIRCRFLDNSDEIREFGNLLRTISKPAFTVPGENDGYWELKPEHIDSMELVRTFELPISISVPKSVSDVTIIFLGNDWPAEPISGFPKPLWTNDRDDYDDRWLQEIMV